MKKIFTYIIVSLIFIAISSQSVSAAKYKVEINVFSNENSFPRKPFSYYIDFKREVNLASLKMNVAGKKNKEVPVYVIPIAKHKAFIYFMPHKKMTEDSELSYILTFESGKWNNKNVGNEKLKKAIKRNPNLVSNYSFEKVRKNEDNFLTWDGHTSVINWRLQDFGRKFASLDKLKSTCRVSTKEALHGVRSLCFSNKKMRKVEVNGQKRNILISGSAHTSKLISLKPDTTYKLSFFMKITKQIDNDMNFQGIGVSLYFLDYNKKYIPGGLFSALYSIRSIMQEEYLNKWVYVETYDTTDSNTYFGNISITEKVLGITYIDMVELREVEDRNSPEIIVDKITEISSKK